MACSIFPRLSNHFIVSQQRQHQIPYSQWQQMNQPTPNSSSTMKVTKDTSLNFTLKASEPRRTWLNIKIYDERIFWHENYISNPDCTRRRKWRIIAVSIHTLCVCLKAIIANFKGFLIKLDDKFIAFLFDMYMENGNFIVTTDATDTSAENLFRWKALASPLG